MSNMMICLGLCVSIEVLLIGSHLEVSPVAAGKMASWLPDLAVCFYWGGLSP